MQATVNSTDGDGSCLQMHIRSGIRYLWTISDFVKFYTDQYLESSPLHFQNGNNRKIFTLKVIKAISGSNGGANTESYFLNFNFRETFLEDSQYHIRYCICDQYGKYITKLETVELQIICGKIGPFYLNLIKEFDLKSKIKEHGTLIIDVFVLDVTFPNLRDSLPLDRVSGKLRKIIGNNPHISITSKQFKQLYKQDSSSDVILLVKDKKFLVHKVVLMANSPTFSILLKQKVNSGEMLCMSMEGFDPSIVAKMIIYMYHNSIENIDEVVFDLYSIAAKYELGGLVKICVNCMIKKTNVENAMAIFFFAVKNNIKSLIEVTENFIHSNVNHVLSSGMFKRMIASYDFQEHGL